MLSYIYRRDTFCKGFGELGTIRSLLLSSVKVLALTATATKKILDCVINQLSMKNPTIVGLSPERDNVMLHVRPASTLKDTSLIIVKDLKSSRIQTSKTVVYCLSLRIMHSRTPQKHSTTITIFTLLFIKFKYYFSVITRRDSSSAA